MWDNKKSIVTFFRESVNASDELRLSTELRLKQGVSTRWNFTFYMLERFLYLRRHVNMIVSNYSKATPIVTASEAEKLTELMKVLNPLEAATREISGEKYVTSSKVIPLVHLLRRKYEKLDITTDLANSLKEAILNEFKKRYGKVEYSHLLAMSTLLDARFKKCYFQDKIACSRTIGFISSAVKDLAIQARADHSIPAQAKENPTKGE